MSLSEDTKVEMGAQIDKLLAAMGIDKTKPSAAGALKLLALTLEVDALNAVMGRLRQIGMPRQVVADYVQAWASMLDAEDAAEKARRS